MATRVGTRGGGWGAADYARAELRREREEEASGDQTMREWSDLVPERGVKLDFVHFPYQIEWYSEEISNAREVVWRKAAQVGMSLYAWRWAARRADQFGDRMIYFFPTDVHVREFGDTRIEPSIRDSEYLLRKIPAQHVHQKGLKQIGLGVLMLRGVHSKAAVQSVDADGLVFDEYDLSDPGNLDQAERRIAGAKAAGRDPRLRRLGYPSIPGYGIDARYEASDQRVWVVTCRECGIEQQVEWANVRWRNYGDDVVLRAGSDEFDPGDPAGIAEAWRVCADCEATLEGFDGSIYRGRWEPQRPGARTIGYHVPRLIVPRTDLIEVVVNSRKTKPIDVENFMTLDLGVPFSSAESALTDRALDAACSRGLDELPREVENRFLRTGGLDVASERDLSLVIDQHLPDGTRQAVHTSEPIDFQEAAEIAARHGVALLVVDSMPERRQARALAATFPGRVVLAQYDEDNPRADAYRYDPKKNMLTLHRTEAIDAMMDAIRQQRKAPPRRPPRNYYAQMKAPKRRTVEDTKGRPRRVYVSTGSAGDDYAHAEVYALAAAELWRQFRYIEEQMAAAAGTPLADEELGFNRARLDEGRDDYYSGLEDLDR